MLTFITFRKLQTETPWDVSCNDTGLFNSHKMCLFTEEQQEKEKYDQARLRLKSNQKLKKEMAGGRKSGIEKTRVNSTEAVEMERKTFYKGIGLVTPI